MYLSCCLNEGHLMIHAFSMHWSVDYVAKNSPWNFRKMSTLLYCSDHMIIRSLNQIKLCRSFRYINILVMIWLMISHIKSIDSYNMYTCIKTYFWPFTLKIPQNYVCYIALIASIRLGKFEVISCRNITVHIKGFIWFILSDIISIMIDLHLNRYSIHIKDMFCLILDQKLLSVVLSSQISLDFGNIKTKIP